MKAHHFLAFDLGAESGRAILGTLDGSLIRTRELTRFPNGPIQIFGHLHWNVYNLFEEIKKGLRAILAEAQIRPDGLAVDTWGVDFGFLASDGSLIGLPFAYRDPRTIRAMEEFLARVPRQKVYDWTGIQFMPFNSLFQVYATLRDKSPRLEDISAILFMPDLFNFLLTGERRTEFTIASTSQLLDPRRGVWSRDLLDLLGIPLGVMPEVHSPGTIVGRLSPSLAKETGLQETEVIATASHDTASAIAAIPASGANWAYISSGTWSLMGIESAAPIINTDALAANFTNEGGVDGTIRFLKNITGLWPLQQCRKEWAKGEPLDYDQLTRLAESAPAHQSFIDPDWPEFLNPPSMLEAIRRFCLRTGQTPPQYPPQTVRSILESLALKYRLTLDQLRRLTDRPIEKIHMIGGGVRNELLCQFAADATGLPVVAGPVEATATGNIMVQALALGLVHSLREIRDVVRSSVESRVYEPSGFARWDRVYERFRDIVNRSQTKAHAE
jgi:rhamnulokinase